MSGKSNPAWLQDQKSAMERAARDKAHCNGTGPNQQSESNVYEPFPGSEEVIYRRKKLSRRNTLSMASRELDLLWKKTRKLESRPEDKHKVSNDKSQEEETLPKTPFNPEQNGVNDSENNEQDKNKSENVQNLQIGNGNFMVFCENVDSRTEKQFRQVGDKNVIINVNSCCNKCQILNKVDHQIVPLDAEGEIWLEIKRRSQTDDGTPMSPTSPMSPSSPMTPFNIPPMTSQNIHAQSQTNSPLNQLSESSKYIEQARVPQLPRQRPKPMEHSESPYDNRSIDTNSDDDEVEDPRYDTIKELPGGRLSMKIPIPTEHEDSTFFTKQNLDSFLQDLSVQEYLSAGGESFELNVCTWTYEKEENYATVDRTQKQCNTVGMYSVPLHDRRNRTQQNDVDDQPPSEMAPPPPSAKDERKWFHEDRVKAHEYLKGKQSGAFLVRAATKPDEHHKYTIEFVDDTKIRRLKILKSEDGFYFEYSENKTFTSLDDMINAILKAGLEVKQDNGQWKTITVYPA